MGDQAGDDAELRERVRVLAAGLGLDEAFVVPDEVRRHAELTDRLHRPYRPIVTRFTANRGGRPERGAREAGGQVRAVGDEMPTGL